MFIWRMKFLDFGGIGATKFARFCGAKKGRVFYFKISDLGVSTALILKQEAISVGGDFITPKELILGEGGCYDGILIATHHQLEKLVKKCAIQPFGLKKIGEIVQEHLDSAIHAKIAESKQDSSLRASEASVAIQNFCDSKNDKNQSCEAPKSRPLRGAKNREQASSSASADFLLEAEKRGTPPKSEKAAAFWEHNLNEVGGSGSGVQPFLREKTSESNAKNGENIADSANQTKIAESNTKSQNLNVDCHDSASQNLAMTENDADSANRRISHENAESKKTNTHPLTPSAREGGQNAENNSNEYPKANCAKSPQIMGIININDDSFFAESRLKNIDKILQKIEAMISQGVAIIDIGAVSSRPGAERVDGKVELERLKEPLDAIFSAGFTQRTDFSLDSYNFECVEFALNRGFSIINDIEGLRDMRLATLAQNSDKKIVLMHNSWIYPPKDSQNIIQSVDDFFAQKIESLYRFGIKKEQIILDFGFGFGKNDSENITLVRNLAHFRHFGCALLVGASMKRTIGALTEQETQNRLFGTLALHQIALDNGADIIRCHNFSAHIDMLKVWSALNGCVRD
ncbi:dihydropteroate synthase [Helicobacter sp. 23-1044]